MDILSVPVKVVEAYLLPHLEWNDLLRMRRVCKWTKAITDDYLKNHPELAPEIEITEKEEGHGFGAFLKLGIPTTKIFLNNTSGDHIYKDAGENLATFLERFGPFVKSLRLDQISLVIKRRERIFLNGLKNLENLEAERCGGYRRGLSAFTVHTILEKKKSLTINDPRIFWDGKFVLPEVKKRLKLLKIGNNDDDDFLDIGETLVAEDLFEYIDRFLSEGKALESVAFPFSPYSMPDPSSQYYSLHYTPLGVHFVILLDHINRRNLENPPLANFKEIDFVSLHYQVGKPVKQRTRDFNASPYFLALCEQCDVNGIKLQNVASSWFVQRETQTFPGDFSNVGIPVCSLVSLQPCVVSLNMPNLKKITIQSSSLSSVGTNWRNNRPAWDSLEHLDIVVDSAVGEHFESSESSNSYQYYDGSASTTMELFNFLFEDVSRTAMTELKLAFLGGAEAVAIPNTENIVAACPNLKKLSLSNWPGTDKALTKLWSGLPELEEVSLEKCKGLGNVAFVGEDVESPVFLKLRKLKKLFILGLEVMPKITDTLFSDVLCHMELTHLILTSDKPVNSITGTGVQMLLGGKFAESIEKFPFEQWSVAQVTKEEFKTLDDMFRSSKML